MEKKSVDKVNLRLGKKGRKKIETHKTIRHSYRPKRILKYFFSFRYYSVSLSPPYKYIST